MYLRYEIDAALDANNIQRLQVLLRNPTFHLGTVDSKTAREYMITLKTFRTQHSGSFVGIQWSSVTKTLQGNRSKKKAILIFF